MKKRWADQERAAEVYGAAADWQEAGFVDETVIQALAAWYPAPPRRLSWIWRTLVFVLASGAVIGGVGFFVHIFDLSWEGYGALALILAICLAVFAHFLRDSRWPWSGAEASCVTWAFVLSTISPDLLGLRHLSNLQFWLLVAVILAAVIYWHWGYSIFAGVLVCFLFLFAAEFSPVRLLWITISAVLIGLSAPRLDRPKLAPPHRRGMAAVLLVSLAALYAAVNFYSLDHRLIEHSDFFLSRYFTDGMPLPWAIRWASILATALMPAALLAWGIRSRRTLVLDAGIVAAALSLLTLRAYVLVAPAWVILSLGGAALALAAFFAERRLNRAPDGEIGGFTAQPLFGEEKRQAAFQLAATAATLPHAAEAGPSPAPDRTAPEPPAGGGGSFDGGGASGKV
jgi:hypothetical protein